MALKLFHRLFRWLFPKESAAPSPDLPSEPDPNVPLARFILDSGQFAATTKRVKPGAFMPAKNGTTSMFRIDGLSSDAVWRLGDVHVAGPRGKPLLASAQVIVENVVRVGLRLDPNNIPPRHVDVVGWPAEKDSQKSMAQELAASAILHIRG